ncbi:MAG: epimerase [Acidobacteriota bacterium]|nr:MAG: epimerase [Acidobacteriota bacterium]
MDALQVHTVTNERELENVLSAPYVEDIEAVSRYSGDLIVLGAGGKMGPTLVKRAAAARDAAGRNFRIIAVSRYSDPASRRSIEAAGAECLPADLLDEKSLAELPKCPHVIFMAGMKFGSSGNQPLTWAMNTYLPGRVAEHFRDSEIVAFSTGNVYPLVPISSGGSKESDTPEPVGEYAQSCLGRERMFEHFAMTNSTPLCLLRLNYAVEARYGVVLDLAQKIVEQTPISLKMGYVNIIWQGDANSICLRSFGLCSSPARILNLTGTEIFRVRWLAEELGSRLGIEPLFEDTEGTNALLNNASECAELFGEPKVSVQEVLDLVVHWVKIGGPTLGKPTKFQVRDGKF